MKVFKASDMRLPINFSEQELKKEIAIALNTDADNIRGVKLLRRSLDARHGRAPVWICTAAAEVDSETSVRSDAAEYSPEKTRLAELNLLRKKTDLPVYIIGSGPAGLFSALTLLTAGIKVVLVERGANVDERAMQIEAHKNGAGLSEVTNVQFGEGGAGTFSDGKLNTGTKGYNSIIYGEFVAHGAPEEIMYSAHPHIGTDYLKKVVKNMREEIIALGGKVMFCSKLDGVCTDGGRLTGVLINGQKHDAERLILAMGQSANDTYEMLSGAGVFMEPKPFSVGVRIEHIQEKISESQYGKYYKMLPPADYKLAAHLKNGRGVYSFCMCPGGEVVAAECQKNRLFTNGMSNFDRAQTNANAAILVSVTPADYGAEDVLSGLRFRDNFEKLAFEVDGSGKAPIQRVEDFLKGRVTKRIGEVVPSFKPGTVFADINSILPNFVCEGLKFGLKDFGNKISEFGNPDAVITGVETRSSSPVRIVRDAFGEASIKGIYPVGEGAGYAGGITSSASDGIAAALKIYETL